MLQRASAISKGQDKAGIQVEARRLLRNLSRDISEGADKKKILGRSPSRGNSFSLALSSGDNDDGGGGGDDNATDDDVYVNQPSIRYSPVRQHNNLVKIPPPPPPPPPPPRRKPKTISRVKLTRRLDQSDPSGYDFPDRNKESDTRPNAMNDKPGIRNTTEAPNIELGSVSESDVDSGNAKPNDQPPTQKGHAKKLSESLVLEPECSQKSKLKVLMRLITEKTILESSICQI